MKALNVRDLQKNLRRSVNLSQNETVVVTLRGRPAAVLIGVEGMDLEQVFLQTDRSFWRLLRRRRGEKASPLATVKRRLGNK